MYESGKYSHTWREKTGEIERVSDSRQYLLHYSNTYSLVGVFYLSEHLLWFNPGYQITLPFRIFWYPM